MLRSTIVVLAAFASSTLGLLHAVDSSSAVSEAIYAKAKGEGFTKAIIRAYEEACGSGGQVDPNFVSSYKNARAAGISNIDAYWFPCTGASNKCKSYATQLSEIGAAFKANSMDITTLWIDIENDPKICKNVSFFHSSCTHYSYYVSCNLIVELWPQRKSRGGQEDCCRSQGIWLQIWHIFEPRRLVGMYHSVENILTFIHRMGHSIWLQVGGT
jgi:hypothetical protein